MLAEEKVFRTIIVAGLLALAGLPFFAYWNSSNSCAGFGRAVELDTKYERVGPVNWQCFVNVDGRWVPREAIREVDIGR